jgi:hypothetical protein
VAAAKAVAPRISAARISAPVPITTEDTVMTNGSRRRLFLPISIDEIHLYACFVFGFLLVYILRSYIALLENFRKFIIAQAVTVTRYNGFMLLL